MDSGPQGPPSLWVSSLSLDVVASRGQTLVRPCGPRVACSGGVFCVAYDTLTPPASHMFWCFGRFSPRIVAYPFFSRRIIQCRSLFSFATLSCCGVTRRHRFFSRSWNSEVLGGRDIYQRRLLVAVWQDTVSVLGICRRATRRSMTSLSNRIWFVWVVRMLPMTKESVSST